MPTSYRDPYSQAQIFVPSKEEITYSEMTKRLNDKEKMLDSKIQEIENMISKLKESR
ncbi:hypothetical protein Alsa2_CDS0004 [Staphylococcus phage Alsa_2]|nr:hypothetical protein Alsa2_CDS0004 [Staphylococcus phage Alsa_2]WNM56330.1 hypothetical protein CoNPh38_CDS0454 [Staphylococcus phage S-CoN_Ph38]